MTFCDASGPILSGISALWPRGQAFLSEQDLNKFVNAYSISENDLKHETLLAKNLHRKDISQTHVRAGPAGFNFAGAGRERTKNFNPRRTREHGPSAA